MRRIKSQIIPFVVWNTLIYLFYVFASRINIFAMDAVEISLLNYVRSVFKSINSPLWFIRTLVVLTLVSPIIVFTWRRKIIAIVWIVFLILTNYLGISTPIISNYYLPIFLLGAYVGKYHEEFMMERHHQLILPGVIGILLCIAIATIYGGDLKGQVLYSERLLGVLSFWFFMDLWKFESPPPPYLQCSFAIFVMHSCIVRTFKVLYIQFMPKGDIFYSMQIILNTIVTLGIIVAINVIMQKHFPKMWKFVLGGR